MRRQTTADEVGSALWQMSNRYWQVAADDVGVAMAQISLDGRWLAANQRLCDLLLSSFDELGSTSFDDRFQNCAVQQGQALRKQLMRGEISRYALEGSIARKDGTVLPVRVVCSLVRDPASDPAKSILAVIEDLTALRSSEAALQEAQTARHELARRLTNAQEQERTRIARELHDDIGQSLAILRIQMLRAGQPISGMIGKRHPTVPELCEELKLLAQKVSRLSHQLHSSELEYLGLAVAIQSHCREFSEKYKVPVDCVCTGIPKDLDSLLALSLLRIVQEALYNAGKYSKAKSIQVEVLGSTTELSLMISDDGVGFDLEEAKFAAGLGLISMRERVHLAGGEFKISSQSGKGTHIAARIPWVAVRQASAAAGNLRS